MEPFTFKCLRCDRKTTPTETHSDNQLLAEAEGWSWGKALLCPNCRPKQTTTDDRLTEALRIAAELLEKFNWSESARIRCEDNRTEETMRYGDEELPLLAEEVEQYRLRLRQLADQ